MVAVAVALVAWFAFRGATRGAFLQWDDDINIQNNVHLRGLNWEHLRWMFTDVTYMRRYVPLSWLRWAEEYHYFGPGPRASHLGNLLFHAADAMLVFCLSRKMLRILPETRDQSRPWPALLAAGLGALAWALHPLRVEAVAWASSGMYCQAAFFLLLSALAYLTAVFSPRPAFRWLILAASALAFALSMMTYPVALGYVGVLLVIDFILLRRFPSGPGGWRDRACRSIWIEKIPFLAITAGILWVTLWGRLHAKGFWAPAPTLGEFGPGARAMQAAYIWAYFVWKQVLPLGLSPVYLKLVSFDSGDPIFVASAAAVLSVTALLIWKRREWPKTLALWLCHLVLLVPMLGLTEHPHYANDRYGYVVGIPWAMALSVVLLHFWENPLKRGAAVASTCAAIVLCGVMSAAQIRIWRDSETLFRSILTELGSDPYRCDILTRLGRMYYSQGRLSQAETSFREAVQARPDAPVARGRLGLLLLEEGRPVAAMEFLGRAARLDPQDADARKSLFNGLLRAGWAAEALQYSEAMVRLNPLLADAQGNLGIVLAVSGRNGEALPHFVEASRLEPDSAIARFNLGLTLRDLGRTAEARTEFEAALRLQPDFPQAREALSRLRALK